METPGSLVHTQFPLLPIYFTKLDDHVKLWWKLRTRIRVPRRTNVRQFLMDTNDFGFGIPSRARAGNKSLVFAPNSSQQMYVIGLQWDREIGRASTWTSDRIVSLPRKRNVYESVLSVEKAGPEETGELRNGLPGTRLSSRISEFMAK